MKISPDDPRLAAYALDELAPNDRQAFERQLDESAEARQEVEQIAMLAGQLRKELASEPLPELTPAQHRAVEARLRPLSNPEPRRGWSRFFPLTIYEALVLLMTMAILAAMLLPALSKAKSRSQRTALLYQQRQQEIQSEMRELYFPPGFNTEAYDRIVENVFLDPISSPLSTFSIDVDTASYSVVRRFLNEGCRPPADAVRVEEMINYFTYNYPQPGDGRPFSVNVEVAGCPWAPEHRLARIGLKGKEFLPARRPACNLVFLIDVSGSMNDQNKLPLVKRGLRLLVEQLTARDTVAIVVYAGHSGLVLAPTRGDQKSTIMAALNRLEAGGSTNGGEGIGLAYATALDHFDREGVNRVILCTDGDFNVGVTSQGELIRLIEEKARTGVFLSVLGFGMGNYKDSTLEKLADRGNGNYGYIDNLNEARKVFVDQMNGTLITIAKDVKIQVEFNPRQVTAYRLIGYENRVLHKEDFNNDSKDAGEIGAGHTVTALYEIVPAGQSVAVPTVDPLKYQAGPRVQPAGANSELMTVKLRYKQPDSDTSELIELPVTDAGAGFAHASLDFKFASAVAAFGMLLRDSPDKGTANLDSVLELAEEGKGPDVSAYRAEFIQLVKQARRLPK